MYDNLCKFLAEKFPNDLATWLLGDPVELVELSPKELSLEPIRADSLLLQHSANLVLHAEFQTLPKVDIPFRMLDYRIRVYRRFPQKEMRQIVIYLKPIDSDLVRQNFFRLSTTYHEFQIIRLWEQPTERFLELPGLLPFAVLSQTDNPTQILNQVAQEIDRLRDKQVQSNIAAASAVLAGLLLEEETIKQILRRDIMRESVIYQEILREGEQKGQLKGFKQGLQEGRQEGEQIANTRIALNLLREGMTVEQVARLTGLSLELVQNISHN